MILVFLGIGILLFVIGFVLNSTNFDDFCAFFACSGIVIFVVSFIVAILLLMPCSELKIIDNRIAMYIEENERIEEQIDVAVKEYQNYEKGTFIECKKENSMTLISLYPELKSDILVQKQIETYVENNNKIKELKDQQIIGKVVCWWLYFGG